MREVLPDQGFAGHHAALASDQSSAGKTLYGAKPSFFGQLWCIFHGFLMRALLLSNCRLLADNDDFVREEVVSK